MLFGALMVIVVILRPEGIVSRSAVGKVTGLVARVASRSPRSSRSGDSTPRLRAPDSRHETYAKEGKMQR